MTYILEDTFRNKMCLLNLNIIKVSDKEWKQHQ